jgi:hypothetical protein
VGDVLDKVLPFTCWIGTNIVNSSVLEEQSRPVMVNTVGDGEKNIFLFDLQNFTLESWVHKFLKLDLRKLYLNFQGN